MIYAFVCLYVYLFSSALWQIPFMEQLEQPQPQLDLPFFLPFMLLTIINVTIAIKTNPTAIEPKFSTNHIYFAPFLEFCFI